MDNPEDNNFDAYPVEREESGWKKTGSFIWEMARITLISLAIILPVRYFLIQPFYVKGASMEPNFHDHEYLIIDELSYRFDEPKRGDIIVFRYPKDPKQFFIKRVIGLPGETVKIENSRVYVSKDGTTFTPLEEPYLAADVQTDLPVIGHNNVKLQSDQYFLMGDNREASMDSRVFGPVKQDLIIGRTWLRGWPLDHLTVFNTPSYNTIK